MQRYSRNWTIKQVATMIDKGTITFDNPLQRPSGIWKYIDKCLLIDSVFRYFFPIILCVQDKKIIDGKSETVYDIIDGKQRLTIIKEYLDDGFSLPEFGPVKLSTGEMYDISNKKFSELSETAQEDFKGTMVYLWCVELEDGDDEEEVVEDLVYRWNNGYAMSKEHLSFIHTDKNVKEFVRKQVTENPLFIDVAKFSETAIKNSHREMSILQSIILLTEKEFKTFAARDVEAFFIDNSIEPELLDKLESIFVDIAEAFDNKPNKFVNKTNIPALVSLFARFNTADEAEQGAQFVRWYSKNYKPGDPYKINCGAGSTKKEKVLGRVNGLFQLYLDYCNNNKQQKTA